MELIRQFAAFIDEGSLPKGSGSTATIDKMLSIVFAFSGSIAVLLIVIGGFRYIVARGDPSATNAAKNTIIYALVGLVIVMAAYSIVTFVVKGIG